jgi:predicted lipoprotein with Yx(FWY)xxD motif
MKANRITYLYKAAAVGVIAITAMMASAAFAQSNVLTDNRGMTVYTFDKDVGGKSTCYASCAAAWPPVAAADMAFGAHVGVVRREDGIQQAAYKGKPLYRFAGDRKPGDVNGDKIQYVWHVVAPGGQIDVTSRDTRYSLGSTYGF